MATCSLATTVKLKSRSNFSFVGILNRIVSYTVDHVRLNGGRPVNYLVKIESNFKVNFTQWFGNLDFKVLHSTPNWSDDQVVEVDLQPNGRQGEWAVILTDTQREFIEPQREITDQRRDFTATQWDSILWVTRSIRLCSVVGTCHSVHRHHLGLQHS